MADYAKLPCRDHDGNFNFVVEAPRGSIVKLKYDPKHGTFVFQRALQLGVFYPYDWGFIASTLAPDGDPLDGMLLFDAPTWPGIVVPAKPIGVVRLTQKRHGGKSERNDRIILRPAEDQRVEDVEDLPKRVRKELEQFFVTATELTDKEVSIEGWEGPTAAEDAIDEAAHRYVRSPAE
jgi:inorganic pyrophosphatase